MLGEHGMFGHGQALHRPVVRVPLIVLGPGVPAGRVVDRPVSLRDVPATVLDLTGDPAPGRFPGRSLARSWGAGGDAGGLVLSEVQGMPWEARSSRFPAASGPIRLVTEGRWAYHRQEHESLGRVERLFDLEADPGEARDLSGDPAHAATLRRLREAMDGAGSEDAETRGEPAGYDGAVP
jgi:arylsulfatase A-like enzyme